MECAMDGFDVRGWLQAHTELRMNMMYELARWLPPPQRDGVRWFGRAADLGVGVASAACPITFMLARGNESIGSTLHRL